MEVPSNNWKVLLLLSVIVPVSFLASFKLAGVFRDPQIDGSVKYPFMLTMSLNKTVFNLGEPVNITLILRNIGTETLTLYFTDGNERPVYTVYAENGTEVYTLQRAYPQVHVPDEMRSGGGTCWSYEWRQVARVFLGWDHYPPFVSEQVPAGKYRVIGFFISDTLGITVETPPAEITVTGE